MIVILVLNNIPKKNGNAIEAVTASLSWYVMNGNLIALSVLNLIKKQNP